MTGKREFGELESFIVRKIRESGVATVREINEHVKDISYTTVMTVMARLAAKGVLKRERVGRAFAYRLGKKIYREKFLKKVKDIFFSDNCAEMVSYFLKDNSNVTKRDLEEIDKLVNSMKSRDKT